MLGSSTSVTAQWAGAQADRTPLDRFAFGGVAFELCFPGDPLALDPEAARFCVANAPDVPTVGTVRCAIAYDAEAPRAVGGDRVDATRHGDTLELRSAQLRAQLCAGEAGGRYRVSARIAESAQALVGLLRAVAAAVVELEGGVTLHASGLELDGQAIALVGPSRAGKSTATTLCEAGRCFAYDHVAVVPGAGGGPPAAWGLPGGTAPAARRASTVHLPLRAVLRVRRGVARPELRPCGGAEALFLLRESVESAETSPRGEETRLAAALQLAGQVEVGTLHTVLGCSLTTLLRSALRGSERDR